MIELSYVDDGIALLVEDDGRGFDPGAAAPPAEGGSGLGLLTIRERSRALGAKLAIGSRPGGGTRVEVRASTSSRPKAGESA